MDESIHEKVEALRTMGNRLRHVHTHDAFCLLRHAFALPKVLYTLRTLPSFQSPQLEASDLLCSLSGSISIALVSKLTSYIIVHSGKF